MFEIIKNDDITKINLLNEKLKNINKKINAIKNAYLNEIDTLEEYKKNKALLNLEKDKINAKLLKLNKLYKIKTETFNNLLKTNTISIDKKIFAIKSIIKKIIYKKSEKTFEIYFID